MTLLLPTPEATRSFGARLARLLRAGDLLLLDGPLGAGKTTLTQGVGAGLGVVGVVNSPTFVIARVNRPAGDGPALVHVDAYRLGSLEELEDLDLETELEYSATVVEWGAGLAEPLSDAHLLIRLRRRPDDAREVELLGRGGDWDRRIHELLAAESEGEPARC